MNTVSTTKCILVAGFPDAGKSTMLAALYGIATDSNPNRPIRLVKYDGDSGYIQTLLDAWQRLNPVPRNTGATEQHPISLRLAADRVGEFELSLVDIAGELFRQLVIGSHVPQELLPKLDDVESIALVVHPMNLIPHELIENWEGFVASLEAKENASGGAKKLTPDPKKWIPDFMPSDVSAIVMLHSLLTKPFARRKIRLVVMISAWELVVQQPPITPAAWLADRMPLLSQMIHNNEDKIIADVFGVSAQGGDYNTQREELAAKSSRAETCFAVTASGDRVHFCEPLICLLVE